MKSKKPLYTCNSCFALWSDAEPVLFDYRKIKQLSASVWGFEGPHYQVDIDFEGQAATWSDCIYKTSVCRIKLDEEKLREFIEKLRECKVADWAEQYCCPYVLDGTRWSVRIQFENDTIKKSGSNAFPKEWDEFCELMQSLVGKPFS